jgi:hypothetical protein
VRGSRAHARVRPELRSNAFDREKTERTRQHDPIEAIQVGSRAHFMRLSAEPLQHRAVFLEGTLQREHADPLLRVVLHRRRWWGHEGKSGPAIQQTGLRVSNTLGAGAGEMSIEPAKHSPLTAWITGFMAQPSEVDARFERHMKRMERNTAAYRADLAAPSRTDGFWRRPELHTFASTGFAPRLHFDPGMNHASTAGSEMNTLDACIAYSEKAVQ